MNQKDTQPTKTIKLTHRVCCKKTRQGWSYTVKALTPTGGESDIIFTTKQKYSNTADMLRALRNACQAVAGGHADYTGLPHVG